MHVREISWIKAMFHFFLSQLWWRRREDQESELNSSDRKEKSVSVMNTLQLDPHEMPIA